MNTSGHESVAITAGMPLFKEALARSGVDKADAPLEAFYLGNWLTDVSQAVDPVAYSGAVGKIRCGVRGFLTSILPDILKDQYNKFEQDFGALLNKFFKPPGNDKEGLRQSVAGRAFKDLFRVAGFFRFACPHQPESMDPKAYLHVFENLYTQYYPHEHMDRSEKQHFPPESPGAGGPSFCWEMPKCPLPQTDYATKVAEGTRSPRRQEKIEPDLYAFMRVDIEIAAGQLAEIDRDWAQTYLRPGGKKVDLDWHLGLARLGHALHPLEDFFAHSNFAELAVRTMPKREFEQFVRGEDITLYRHRLKKFTTEERAKSPNWHEEPYEPNVVSGYFDFSDTLVSLGHIGEHLYLKRYGPMTDEEAPHDHKHADNFFEEARERAEKRVKKEAKEDDEKCSKRFKHLLGDLLVYVTDRDAAEAEEKNEVARIYKGRRPPASPREVAREVVTSHPLFKDVADEIKESFVNGVELFAATEEVGGVTISLFSLLDLVTKFVEEPITLLNYFFSELLHLPELGAFVVSGMASVIYSLVGANRIGCHSLMAKDHGPSGLLYHEMRECALAVHWYVISTLTRWTQPKPVRVCRAPKDASGKSNLNTLDAPVWIDWLELLEFFLRHPSGEPKSGQVLGTIPTTIQYVVKETDSFASLADQFRSSAVVPGTFTWRNIAIATYQSAVPAEINRQMKLRGQGTLLADGINYKFKPGVIVRIPGQRYQVPPAEAPTPEKAWYRYVMIFGWEIIQKREDCMDEQKRPFNRHALIYITAEELDEIIEQGRDLMAKAEDAYVPH